MCVCVCFSVSRPEHFLGPERTFWSAEKIPPFQETGCLDDKLEEQVKGGLEEGVPGPEGLS